ncbi:MAG: hypothetical protein OHK0048_24940 [Rhodoferax sp.]
MDLIACDPEQLFVGLSLDDALRDQSGQLLLVKGQKITAARQLQGIQSRKTVFIEVDDSRVGLCAPAASRDKLDQTRSPV